MLGVLWWWTYPMYQHQVRVWLARPWYQPQHALSTVFMYGSLGTVILYGSLGTIILYGSLGTVILYGSLGTVILYGSLGTVIMYRSCCLLVSYIMFEVPSLCTVCSSRPLHHVWGTIIMYSMLVSSATSCLRYHVQHARLVRYIMLEVPCTACSSRQLHLLSVWGLVAFLSATSCLRYHHYAPHARLVQWSAAQCLRYHL